MSWVLFHFQKQKTKRMNVHHSCILKRRRIDVSIAIFPKNRVSCIFIYFVLCCIIIVVVYLCIMYIIFFIYLLVYVILFVTCMWESLLLNFWIKIVSRAIEKKSVCVFFPRFDVPGQPQQFHRNCVPFVVLESPSNHWGLPCSQRPPRPASRSHPGAGGRALVPPPPCLIPLPLPVRPCTLCRVPAAPQVALPLSPHLSLHSPVLSMYSACPSTAPLIVCPTSASTFSGLFFG